MTTKYGMFKYNKIGLLFLGIDFNKTGSVIFKIRLWSMLIFLQLAAILNIRSLFENNVPLVGRCMACMAFGESLTSISKVIIMNYKVNILRDLLESLDDIIFYDEVTKRSWLISKLFMYSLIGITVAWGLIPLVLSSTPIPYWFPFDVTTPTGSRFNFSFATINLVHLAYIAGVCDTLLIMMATQIYSKLTYLKEQLVMPIEKNTRNSKIIENENYRIIKCIKEHDKIMTHLRDFIKIIGPIFFVQIICSTLLSCIFAFAMQQADTTLDQVKLLPAMAGIYVQFYLHCWYGQNITDVCNDLHIQFYNVKWYELKLSTQKLLLITQTYTSRSIVIKGANLFTMSKRSFMMAIRESISYYMFLRTIARNN